MTKETLDMNITLVLEGFDKRIFVRNATGDDAPDWGIKLIPYLMALKALTEYIEAEIRPRVTDDGLDPEEDV